MAPQALSENFTGLVRARRTKGDLEGLILTLLYTETCVPRLTSTNFSCSLLTNHIDRCLDIIPRNAWKHTRIHHPQPFRAAYAEL